MKTIWVFCILVSDSRLFRLNLHSIPIAWLAIAAVWLAALSAHGQTLAVALDGAGLTWSTGGNAAWQTETTDTSDGVDAARSGAIADSQESWIQTTVTGSGTLSFHWQVSSESGWDYLRFSVDGAESNKISGKVSWTPVSLHLDGGTHTVRWAYTKDNSQSTNADAGWLDQVVFNPDLVKPTFTQDPAGATVLPGDEVEFWANASGTPAPAYQWQYNGTDLPDATFGWLRLADISLSQAGQYRVIASNAAGSATSAVAVLTVKTPVPIQLLGTWPQETGGQARGLYVTNNLAYVANGPNGLVIVDVHDPAHCARLGGTATDGWAHGVVVVGDYAYVAAGNGLQIFDVSHPATCTLVGGYRVTNEVYNVAVSGHYAFLVDGYRSGLHVLDVAPLAGSVYVGGWNLGGEDLALAGSYAFVANYGSGLRVVDISTPTNCLLLGNFSSPDYSLLSLVLAGNRAYSASQWSGLTIWDISNPASCLSLGSCRIKDGATSVAVSGRYAFLTSSAGLTAELNPGRLELVDISDPTNSFRAGVLNVGGDAWRVVAAGDRVYVANGTNGLAIVRVAGSGVRLRSPAVPAPGQPLVLWIANVDDSPITADKLASLQVQYSEDLRGWTNLTATPSLNGGQVQVNDPLGCTRPRRFYRVQQ